MGLNGLRSLANQVESMKDDLDDKPQAAVRRNAARTVASAKERVVQEDAVASTELFRGIGYKRRGSRTIIESAAPHSGFVEFGTGQQHITNPWTRHYKAPDFSPQLVGVLTEWVVQKPSLRGQIHDPVSFAEKVAWNISGNNPDRPSGSEAQPFFRPAWNRNKALLLEEVRFAVRNSIN